jgi:hypothetical protein
MRTTAVRVGQRPGARAFWASLGTGQRLTLLLMALVVAGLRVMGF